MDTPMKKGNVDPKKNLRTSAESVEKKEPQIIKQQASRASASEPQKKVDKFIPHKTSLQIGKKAPSFKGINQHGKTISLADFKGKKIVLYFYPKDSTPGCTMEACSLRDEHTYFTKENYVVIGVSADDEKSHQKFATKNELPFSLLADTDMTIIKAYDVWGTKQFMGKIYDGIIRTTFIINEKRILSQVITDVKTKEHAQQIVLLEKTLKK